MPQEEHVCLWCVGESNAIIHPSVVVFLQHCVSQTLEGNSFLASCVNMAWYGPGKLHLEGLRAQLLSCTTTGMLHLLKDNNEYLEF
jgi:hypothetical protein